MRNWPRWRRGQSHERLPPGRLPRARRADADRRRVDRAPAAVRFSRDRRWESLCAAATRFGNGIVEVTARGSLQFRGLLPGNGAALRRGGGGAAHTGSRSPAITTSPLAGRPRRLPDRRALVAANRGRGAGLALHPKFSIAIDDGSSLHLEALAADLRLCAAGPQHSVCVQLSVGGRADTAVPLGTIALQDAAASVARILAAVGHRRMRDVLVTAGLGHCAILLARC